MDDRILPPLPQPGYDNAEFWAGCRRHELRIQRCRSCHATRFHPRPACPECASLDVEWITCSGRGAVYTFTVIHPPTLPAFAPLVPYAVGIIRLEEGVFMVGQIRGCAPEEVAIGMAVEVEFDDVTPDTSLPHWRRATGREA
jgi:uncharacterized OB-fold protein